MLARKCPPNDGAVGCAVEDAADVNDVELVKAEYTDEYGVVLGPVGPCSSTASILTGAQGVKATTRQEFDTFLGGVVGIPTFTAETDATAVVGVEQNVCPAAAGCGALPVTFPQAGEICDDTELDFTIGEDDGDGIWEPYELLDEDAVLNAIEPGDHPALPGQPRIGRVAGLRLRQPREPHREPVQRQHPDPVVGADPYRQHQLLRGRAQ